MHSWQSNGAREIASPAGYPNQQKNHVEQQWLTCAVGFLWMLLGKSSLLITLEGLECACKWVNQTSGKGWDMEPW